MRAFLLGFLLLIITFSLSQQSCTHDPIMVDDMEMNPIDTTVIDTMQVDTTSTGIPCDPDIVYFENDILPILLGSCAYAGCHDASTAKDGVILDSYENVINTAEVIPFDLNESELYEVITENDPDDIMPPSGKLDNEKINLITSWILQGAENLFCDEGENCEVEDVSFNGFVQNVFNISCNGCHSSSNAFGGIILDTYQDVKTVVDAGRLYGSINWNTGFSQMPQNQAKLDSCTIAKVKSWIDEGAQNN